MEGKFICNGCKLEFDDDGEQYTRCPLCGDEKLDYVEKDGNITYINGIMQ